MMPSRDPSQDTRRDWSELDELADRYATGELGEAAAQRLNEFLRGDAAAQDRFLSVTAIHASLLSRLGPAEPIAQPTAQPSAPPTREPRGTPAPPRRLRLRPAWAAALAGLAGVLIAAVWIAGRVQPTDPRTPTPQQPAEVAEVATLRSSAGAEWAYADLSAGATLSPGRLRLSAGVAVVEFLSGAMVVLEGPAELDLLDARSAFLHRGGIVVRVPPTSVGFRLETPEARLRDLGTEFGVRTGLPGAAVLQVYEGEVLAELKSAVGREQRVPQGTAVELSAAAELPFVPERFVRALPGPDDPTGRGKLPYNRSRHSAVRVAWADAPPTVDGDLSDWDPRQRFRAECEPPYQNHFLEAAMMYDERNLYISAHVGDPYPLRSRVSPEVPRELYGMGGGIALRISTDRTMGWPARGVAPWSVARRGRTRPEDTNEKLSFLMLWHHQGRACVQSRHGMDLHGMRVNPPGYAGAFRRDADGQGYTVEYALSWELLNAADDPPRPGDELAAAWLAHWSDPDGRIWKGQLIEVLNPADGRWNIEFANTWGKAIYQARK